MTTPTDQLDLDLARSSGFEPEMRGNRVWRSPQHGAADVRHCHLSFGHVLFLYLYTVRGFGLSGSMPSAAIACATRSGASCPSSASDLSAATTM